MKGLKAGSSSAGGGTPIPTFLSLVSSGILQNNCTISGNVSQGNAYLSVFGTSPGYINIPNIVSGYNKLTAVLQCTAIYTQLRITVNGRSITSPSNTNRNTVNLELSNVEPISSITLQLTPYQDGVNIFDVWLSQ